MAAAGNTARRRDRRTFPAVRFLLGLNATEETPARTPWWLMALRLAAAGLVIVALARPVMDAGAALNGSGPVLLVIDNGWASASDWVRRKEAAGALLDRAERAGRKAVLLVTAPDGNGGAQAVSAEMPVAESAGSTGGPAAAAMAAGPRRRRCRDPRLGTPSRALR